MRAAICSPAAAFALVVHAGQLRPDGRDGVVDLRVLCIHSVHQFRVERGSLAQQGEEQLVLAGVVGVQEVQHLPGVRADEVGSRTVIGRRAEQSGKLTELAPDDAVDQNHLVGIEAGSGGAHRDCPMVAAFWMASRAVVAGRPMSFTRSSRAVNNSVSAENSAASSDQQVRPNPRLAVPPELNTSN
jgi:hypothetical protein